jgi:hypothetical protein
VLTVTKANAPRHLQERYAGIFKGTPAGAAMDEAIEGEDDAAAANRMSNKVATCRMAFKGITPLGFRSYLMKVASR